MRGFLLRLAMLLTLAGILGGQVTELFDRWDHTLQTGKDIDYVVVVAAACAGLAFVVAKKAVSLFEHATRSENSLAEESSAIFHAIIPERSATGPSPPPLLPLRI